MPIRVKIFLKTIFHVYINANVFYLPFLIERKQKPLEVWQVRTKRYTGCLKMNWREHCLLEVAAMIMWSTSVVGGYLVKNVFKLSPRPPFSPPLPLKSKFVLKQHFPTLVTCRTSPWCWP